MNPFIRHPSTINPSNLFIRKKIKQMNGFKFIHLILWIVNDSSTNFQNSMDPLINT